MLAGIGFYKRYARMRRLDMDGLFVALSDRFIEYTIVSFVFATTYYIRLLLQFINFVLLDFVLHHVRCVPKTITTQMLCLHVSAFTRLHTSHVRQLG